MEFTDSLSVLGPRRNRENEMHSFFLHSIPPVSFVLSTNLADCTISPHNQSNQAASNNYFFPRALNLLYVLYHLFENHDLIKYIRELQVPKLNSEFSEKILATQFKYKISSNSNIHKES